MQTKEPTPEMRTAAPREAGPRKHWPDCATNHGYSDCDMGPDCGSPPPAAAGQEEGLREVVCGIEARPHVRDSHRSAFPCSNPAPAPPAVPVEDNLVRDAAGQVDMMASLRDALARKSAAAAPVGAESGKPHRSIIEPAAPMAMGCPGIVGKDSMGPTCGAEHRPVITPALTAKFIAKAKQRAEEAQRKIKEPDLRPLCSAKTRRGNPCEMRAEGAGGLCIQHGLSAWNRLAKRAMDEEECDEARVHARNEEARAEELGRRLSAIDVELVTTRTERYAAIARAAAAEQSASALRQERDALRERAETAEARLSNSRESAETFAKGLRETRTALATAQRELAALRATSAPLSTEGAQTKGGK